MVDKWLTNGWLAGPRTDANFVDMPAVRGPNHQAIFTAFYTLFSTELTLFNCEGLENVEKGRQREKKREQMFATISTVNFRECTNI